MSDLEKEIFGDQVLLDLLIKHFKKIKKIKKDKLEEFIRKYEKELKKIAPKRNWQVWLIKKKKNYDKALKESKDDGKGTGLPNIDLPEESLDDEPIQVLKDYEKNKEREKERRKKEIDEIEKQLKPYNAKLIEYKDFKDYIGKENTNVLLLANDENIVIDDKNLTKLREDEGQFITTLEDGRVMLVDNLTSFVEVPFSKESDEEDIEESSEEEDIYIELEDLKTISQNRKAFVNWVNDDLYKRIEKLKYDSPLQIYQLLIKEYLSLETPYRGVLVYHGLGTGKTASAVSLAEGLSTELKINTLLPASLETEFIKEVQTWGREELNKGGLWKLYSDKDISDNEMVNELDEKYNLNAKNRKSILRNTKNTIKSKMLNENPDTNQSEIKKMENDLNKLSGVWLPDPNGKRFVVEEGEEDPFTYNERIYLEQQLNFLIHKKYNFIHYNPFPKVKESKLQDFIEEEDEEDELDLLLDPEEQKKLNTHNKKIVDSLEKKLKRNIREHYVDSPFYNEVLIIDEVHNLVRQILNDNPDPEMKNSSEARRARVFYNWIVNSENTKLIFLSGTPVINRPCEIAILYNMLKGLIKIYSFTIKTDIGIDEANDKLEEILYDRGSPVELFHIDTKEGKLVISFIQEKTNFKSVKDKDKNIVYSVKANSGDFNDFIEFIYKSLHNIFDKKDISPTQTQFKELSQKEIRKIRLGERFVFDKDLDISFNRHQKLFDIYENDEIIDTTRHEHFMSYFFENGDIVPEKKKILLKRMLMGLTSYYPIDRSSIVYMPEVLKPHIKDERFKYYSIVKNLNIVECPFSEIQFQNYLKGLEWQEKIEELQRGRNEWDDTIHHYSIRTRQACNVVFNDEENFRMMKKNFKDKEASNEASKEIERFKQAEYTKIRDNQLFRHDKALNDYSPKFLEIYKNMQRFIKDKKPTGKILFYSDFRSDAGSEAFELMLQCNGYSKLNTENLPESKDLRYTFITGSESPDERRKSKLYFNDEKNIYGDYCQVMIISSAGAEGISLTCVRQVHILEPYWNYVRIDQVLGRAIRMRSHTGKDIKNPWLPKEKQNVEQYIYLSAMPKGLNPEDIYSDISKRDNWSVPKGWKKENIKTELSKESNRGILELIEDLIRVNVNYAGETADENLFRTMEHKYRFSLQITDIIKESALDCIQHTTDDPELNDKCIRFSDKLTGEIAYFPGIGAKVLEHTDIIQLKSKYIYKVKDNLYVISAKSDDSDHNIYLYYEYKTDKKTENIDIRYLRENGKRICDVYIDTNMVLLNVDPTHPYNKKLDKEFSVFQEIYNIPRDIITGYIEKQKFPTLDKIIKQEYLEGYKLKYNVNDSFFYMGKGTILSDKCIQKIYPYALYEEDSWKIVNENPIIILDGELFISE